MRHEFDIDLKPSLPKPPPRPKPIRAPAIRKTLIMAYQIADYMAANNIRTLKEFCWRAHITRARATQITNMLFLAPSIQVQILMGEGEQLLELREDALRPLLKEVFWPRQEEMWRTWRSVLKIRERWIVPT